MRWRRKRTERDFRDEIQSHLDIEADELKQSGMSERESVDVAHRHFGNVGAAQERFYESRRVLWLDHLRQDLAYALRTLRLNPAYSLTSVITLALGIGVVTTVFSLVYAIGMRQLPVREAGRVISIYQDFHGEYSRRVFGSRYLFSLPEYAEYRDGTRAFEGLAAYAEADVTLGGSTTPAHLQFVSCDYFGVMRARLVAGRGFVSDECDASSPSPLAVVSHAFWQRELGSDPSVVGSTIRLGPRVVTVVGVAEPDFRGTALLAPGIWLPLPMHAVLLPGAVDPRDRDMSWLTLVGRLKQQAMLATARAQLALISRRLDAERPGRVTALHVNVGALASQPELRSKGLAAAGAIGAIAALVLLMACVNVASLSLSRAVVRRREIGIRLALGAGRPRLIRQLLTESIVLGLFGAAVGVTLATWLPPMLVAAIPAAGMRIDLAPDARVVGLALIVAILAAVASGLAPAIQATKLDLSGALKGDGVNATGGAATLRARLVGAQMAGSVLLLVMSALLLRGVRHAQVMDPGFETHGVVAITPDLSAVDYSPERATVLYATLAERLRTMPGVQSVATAQWLPLLARGSTYVSTTNGEAAEGVPAAFAVVSGAYLSTMRILLVRGRSFTDAESRTSGTQPRPVVVSAALARRLWGTSESLGGRLSDGDGAYYVIGVAADVHNTSFAERDAGFVYKSAPSEDPRGMKIIVRESGTGGGVAGAIPALVATLDAGVPVLVESYDDRLARMLVPARTAATICGIIGVLATLLALVGVYGVASYNVTSRTREIAVRIALGASVRQVLTLVMAQGARTIGIGLIVGALLAAAGAQLLRGILFGVSALDPVAFGGALVLLASAAFLAMYRPARRAADADPVTALRVD